MNIPGIISTKNVITIIEIKRDIPFKNVQVIHLEKGL